MHSCTFLPVYTNCCHISSLIPKLKIKLWPCNLCGQNAGSIKEKIWNPGFITDISTAFLWRTMGPSIGEEARDLSLTDIATEARFVRDVDEVLVMSKMERELWLCQMVAMEHWLYQGRGWSSSCIRNEDGTLTYTSVASDTCYIKYSPEWTPGFLKPGHTDLALLIFATELIF